MSSFDFQALPCDVSGPPGVLLPPGGPVCLPTGSLVVRLKRCDISLLTGNSFPDHTAAGSDLAACLTLMASNEPLTRLKDTNEPITVPNLPEGP